MSLAKNTPLRYLGMAIALLLTVGSLTAHADFIYTFERTSSEPYSFSFTFPTLQTGVQDPFGPLPFTVQGVTFLDSFLTAPGFVGFSAIANSLRVVDPDGNSVAFDNDDNAMVLLSSTDISGPGVYPLSFIIFNTTSLPVVERLIITDTTATDRVATLNPAHLWIGLKNGDDQGTRFDVKAEVYLNDTLISEGLTRCITGVTRNPSKALEVTVPFGPIMAHEVEASDVLSLKILTRIGTNPDDSKCPGHNNAVGLRLYYDAQSRASRFGVEITPDPLTDVFLHSDGTDFLDALAPTAAAAKFKDSSSLNVAGGNPWKEIGTWSMSVTVP